MTNNTLKIIAIITMVIDHFGYYFCDNIPLELYYTCRIIGRIAMPIFTYLVIEGYFHTSNLKKYLIRLFSFGCITQISFCILDFIAKDKSYNLASLANILFVFVMLLIIIKLFENAIEKKSLKNKLIFVIALTIIIFLNKVIRFDYGIYLLLLGVAMYLSKKYIKDEIIYKISIVTIMLIQSLIMMKWIQIFSVLAIIPIILYNGKLGKKSKVLKTLFYLIFPLQHIVMYLLSVII